MYHCWFISCDKYTMLIENVNNGDGETNYKVHGNSLHHLCNFSVNQKKN